MTTISNIFHRTFFFICLVLFLTACSAATTSGPTATPFPPTATATLLPEPTVTPPPATDSPAAEATEAPATATLPPAQPLIYHINPERSEVRFLIDEELLGAPKTVIGVTNMITGSVTVDPAYAEQAEVSVFQIDARDLTTDSSFRNRALRRQILQSEQDDFRYILFITTGMEEMPASATAGETVKFKLIGDLTIRDITNEATFDMEVTVDDNQLNGTGTTTIMRDDFELTIPSVPNVANVSEEVILEINFQAVAELEE